MNINRHNYEEFFILYMDNELGSAERRMVEAFVQNNPDLKDELDILLQSKLAPDNNIIFENKNELIRTTEGSGIDLTNYEEWLTLYIDNELTLEQKSEVEKFVAADPQVQTEFAILQKTKLQPEEIVFPNKESLYRRTEKVRVIQMRWWRVAAAVVFLIAISTTALIILNNNKKQPGGQVAKNPVKNEQKTIKENSVVANTENKIEIVQPGQKEQLTEQTPKQINKSGALKLANNNMPEKKLPNVPATNKKEEQAIVDNNPSNNLPQPINNPYLKSDAIKTEIAANTPYIEKMISPTSNGPVTKEPSNPFLTNTTTPGKPVDNPDAVFASSKESTSLEEGGQNKKSRGFFRKAVRFFEKTTKINPANDDDKVLIGGLAVKLN